MQLYPSIRRLVTIITFYSSAKRKSTFSHLATEKPENVFIKIEARENKVKQTTNSGKTQWDLEVFAECSNFAHILVEKLDGCFL